ncbi:M20 peptidase aminoacylase family protein [Rummeliibacillus pycnus]|uniref:M20 peptidase aminoacylase family protein n=1 Tax=Rummeliibacillus pycnus TaxID=101070 RepID=UPI0037CBE934
MKTQLKDIEPRLKEIFEYLHANPEIAWQEYNTTTYITNLLKQEGYEVHTFSNSTGLYVEIGHGKPVIGLRTDMDALLQEVDGEMRANHSCGHDGHMTMIIGVLLLIKKLKIQFNGTLRVLFQPAEEKGEGALSFVEKGLIDDIDYLFGVHVRPIQELEDGTFSPALHHGASMMIAAEIYGVEAHAARPHLGKNAIEIGSSLVEALKSIHIDTMIPYSVKVTKFHSGGESGNIIPGKAFINLDVRAQTNEGMNVLVEDIHRIVEAVSTLYDANIVLKVLTDIAAAKVDEDAQEILEHAIIQSVGPEKVRPPLFTPGGEDFHFYTKQRPNVKTTMLGLGCGLTPGLHHPNMTFNREQLITGVEILTRTVLCAFEYAKLERKITQ